MGCILSKFYIKPQHDYTAVGHCFVVSYRNSTSNHNPVNTTYPNSSVVSYRNSTSNHNPCGFFILLVKLYLIEILHQTTTAKLLEKSMFSCILSKFYIKPQLRRFNERLRHVVSYRNSTSNHNDCRRGRAFF